MSLTSHAGGYIDIVIAPDDEKDIASLLNGREYRTLTRYGGPSSRRNVVEIILFIQALELGGSTMKPRFVVEENYKRMLRIAGNGEAVAVGSSIWWSDIDHNRFLISPPLLKNGESVVGLYTSPNNNQALRASSLEEIQELRAVSNQNWPADWALLQSLGVASLHHARNWHLMFDMVSKMRVDFMLSRFSDQDDLGIEYDQRKLVPIPGFAIVLPGSRHWVVSKSHAQGMDTFSTLIKGMALLNKQGRIRQAYFDSGFFTPKVKGWQLLNPTESIPASNTTDSDSQ
ncbi:hypothetical protein [Teredinibacter sp. KSP-S5-2]|uniref:hypothetical protein n=1 Tax=Teredinibacter sp. KSP-S5-2 TaxID=3034506 RepID=UPI002934702F|nr:hypothetical protein [Teredinibacter sp. KSP-S5-2]WNO08435.1 hypothetical protein P5V12_15805 [Teredinibacter sp. KSP-S5-2]